MRALVPILLIAAFIFAPLYSTTITHPKKGDIPLSETAYDYAEGPTTLACIQSSFGDPCKDLDLQFAFVNIAPILAAIAAFIALLAFLPFTKGIARLSMITAGATTILVVGWIALQMLSDGVAEPLWGMYATSGLGALALGTGFIPYRRG